VLRPSLAFKPLPEEVISASCPAGADSNGAERALQDTPTAIIEITANQFARHSAAALIGRPNFFLFSGRFWVV
jgi:hypothetical protein